MWIRYPLCRAWSLHWQYYGRILLVRDFGSIILPIAGLHCLVNVRNAACSAPSKYEKAWSMQAGPKRGDFVRPKHLVVVDGDGSLWNNMRLPSFQTRPTSRSTWSEMFLKPENKTVWKLWQLSIIYISRIIMILTVKTTGKSRGKSATTQIRHNLEKRILGQFFLLCD